MKSYAHLDSVRTDEDAAEAIVRFRNTDAEDVAARRSYMKWFFGKTRGMSADDFEAKMAIAQVSIFNLLMNKRELRVSARANAKMVERKVWNLPGEFNKRPKKLGVYYLADAIVDGAIELPRNFVDRHYPWDFPRRQNRGEEESLPAEPAFTAWRGWREPVPDPDTGKLDDRYRAMRNATIEDGLFFLKQGGFDKTLCISADLPAATLAAHLTPAPQSRATFASYVDRPPYVPPAVAYWDYQQRPIFY